MNTRKRKARSIPDTIPEEGETTEEDRPCAMEMEDDVKPSKQDKPKRERPRPRMQAPISADDDDEDKEEDAKAKEQKTDEDGDMAPPAPKRKRVRDRRKNRPVYTLVDILAIEPHETEKLQQLRPYAYQQRWATFVLDGKIQQAKDEIHARTESSKQRLNLYSIVRNDAILKNIYNLFSPTQVLNADWVLELRGLLKKLDPEKDREAIASINKFLGEYTMPEVYARWGLVLKTLDRDPLSPIIDAYNQEQRRVRGPSFPHPFDPWISAFVADQADVDAVRKQNSTALERKSERVLDLSGKKADDFYNTFLEKGLGPDVPVFCKLFALMMASGRRKAFFTTHIGRFERSKLGDYYMRVTRDVKKREAEQPSEYAYDCALLIPYDIFASEVDMLRGLLEKDYKITKDDTVLSSSKKIAAKCSVAFRSFCIDNKVVKDLTEFGTKCTTIGNVVDNCTVHTLRAIYVYLLTRSFGADSGFNFKMWTDRMLGHVPGHNGRSLVTYDGMAARGDMLQLLGVTEYDHNKQDHTVPQPNFPARVKKE